MSNITDSQYKMYGDADSLEMMIYLENVCVQSLIAYNQSLQPYMLKEMRNPSPLTMIPVLTCSSTCWYQYQDQSTHQRTAKCVRQCFQFLQPVKVLSQGAPQAFEETT